MSIAARIHRLKTSPGGIPDGARLAEHLQVALEVELATLPPYMCAL